MKLDIRYFGGLRERLGVVLEQVEVKAAGGPDAPATVDDLWRALVAVHPQLEGMRGFVRVAVNLDFAAPDTVLSASDEIALIPPVSGGSGGSGSRGSASGSSASGGSASGGSGNPEDAEKSTGAGQVSELSDESGAFRVTQAVLVTEEVERHVRRGAAGALVVFEGMVRDHTGPRAVSYLEYDIYLEMALQKLQECAGEVRERWPQARVAIHHRWGRLEIGEAAVVIAVSSPHRKQAFLACEYAIDRLKEIVPVWKKEVGPDGAEWIGMGP